MIGYDWASNWGNWGTHGLDYYVCAKLLWDPYRDVTEIVTDYISSMFQEGASYMKQYYNFLLEKYNDGQKYSEKDVDKLQYYIDQAKNATKSVKNTKAFDRIVFIEEGLDYLKHINNLFVIGQDVILGKRDPAEYQQVKTKTYDYLNSTCFTWSVATVQNFRRLKLSINEIERQMADKAK